MERKMKRLKKCICMYLIAALTIAGISNSNKSGRKERTARTSWNNGENRAYHTGTNKTAGTDDGAETDRKSLYKPQTDGISFLEREPGTELRPQTGSTGFTYSSRGWKRDSYYVFQRRRGADGYIIYRSETKNEWRKGKLKKYKVLRGEKNTKLTVPKVKNGMCYHYGILAYAVKKGVTIEGNTASYSRYADYYGHENESYEHRWKRIYQNKKTEYDHRKSGKYMTTIRVKVWDFAHGMSGRKITKSKTFSVHKKIAPTMKKILTLRRHSASMDIREAYGEPAKITCTFPILELKI